MGNIIATDSPPDEQAVPEQNFEEVDATNPDSIAYKLQQIKDIIEAQDIGDDVLLEKMESITSLSKYLWNKYNSWICWCRLYLLSWRDIYSLDINGNINK